MAKKSEKPVFGAINVPFAIFWSVPGVQEYENISGLAAANPITWAGNLTTEERLWLVDKVNTTAIFGEQVVIVDQQDKWFNVAAVLQRTRDNEWGQIGWVPASQVTVNNMYQAEWLHLPVVVVAVPLATLFRDIHLTEPVYELSYQVKLPLLAEREYYFKVRLPDGGIGYLSRCEALKASDLCFSRKNIIAEARQFLDLRYLWGGISSYGFDCSGFTFRLYQSQGIYLPRNSRQQSQEGTPVGKECLLPGDLLFFATDKGKGYIHHVGMYVKNYTMIHAPESRSAIKESRFDVDHYAQEYWGARRYGYEPEDYKTSCIPHPASIGKVSTAYKL
ncbi:Hypothetical protein LUCI_4281 [Lucifera butyrica]|uniref:NlpC/P60 domain-containing protein n=1 Tax=Lucifera butyrica TaxID=1351585 RepID=A0A498RDF3_9FIRM|nr:C40 family peptidase [Lucifera butyrica]VBB08995.1 Hypothetical protein LUCI_4281 [Lucifera butyrica]